MKRPLLPIVLLALVLALPLSLRAADFDRYAPKTVPAAPPSGKVDEPLGASTSGAETVLMPRLEGLFFVKSPRDVVPTGRKGNGVVIETEIPDPAAFRALLSPRLGKPVTRGDLDSLVREIVLYFRAHDRPIVDVIVPEQEVTEGRLQVILLEGRVGKVTATGARWASNDAIKAAIPFRTGAVIRGDEVERNVARANTSPFRATTVFYSAGQAPGTTDVELRTQDRFPLRGFAGYEDSGNVVTGRDRYLAGFNWGDSFGLFGSQLNYQYMMSGNNTSLRSHSGSWSAPVPWAEGHSVSLFGSHVATAGELPGGFFQIGGTSYQASGRYNVELPKAQATVLGASLGYTQSAGAGIDYKYSSNSLAFGGIPALTGTTEVYQLASSYSGQLTDPHGTTGLDAQFFWSPGGFGGANTDTAFDNAHPGATSHYAYGLLSLSRDTPLPGGWSLFAKGSRQFSDANLAPSEQLALGGYASVRGYEEQEVIADEGWFTTAEIRAPALSLSPRVASLAGTEAGNFADQLVLLGFWDYGSVWNRNLTSSDQVRGYTLSSVGLGLRYTLGAYASVRFDYGWQLHSTGLDQNHGSRGSLGVVVSY